jgi:hypothetical protein
VTALSGSAAIASPVVSNRQCNTGDNITSDTSRQAHCLADRLPSII